MSKRTALVNNTWLTAMGAYMLAEERDDWTVNEDYSIMTPKGTLRMNENNEVMLGETILMPRRSLIGKPFKDEAKAKLLEAYEGKGV